MPAADRTRSVPATLAMQTVIDAPVLSKARGEDAGETVTNDVISVSAVSAVQTLVL